MSVTTPRDSFIGLVIGLALALPALAQQPVGESPVQVNPCGARAKLLSRGQEGDDVRLAVEVTVEDCEGLCTGSLEYELVFVDAGQRETRWHLTRPWNWREAADSFTLDIGERAAPGTTLQAVDKLTIGRCTCSVTRPFGT